MFEQKKHTYNREKMTTPRSQDLISAVYNQHKRVHKRENVILPLQESRSQKRKYTLKGAALLFSVIQNCSFRKFKS